MKALKALLLGSVLVLLTGRSSQALDGDIFVPPNIDFAQCDDPKPDLCDCPDINTGACIIKDLMPSTVAEPFVVIITNGGVDKGFQWTRLYGVNSETLQVQYILNANNLIIGDAFTVTDKMMDLINSKGRKKVGEGVSYGVVGGTGPAPVDPGPIGPGGGGDRTTIRKVQKAVAKVASAFSI